MLYEYRCPECGHEQEVVLPINEYNAMQVCASCNRPTKRVFSLPAIVSSQPTGRDKVLKTLNKEEGGYGFPGGDMHRPRYEQAMAKSLSPPKEVVGRGFG